MLGQGDQTSVSPNQDTFLTIGTRKRVGEGELGGGIRQIGMGGQGEHRVEEGFNSWGI